MLDDGDAQRERYIPQLLFFDEHQSAPIRQRFSPSAIASPFFLDGRLTIIGTDAGCALPY